MDHHKKDLLYIILFFTALFIAWVMIGGPQHAKQTGDAYNTLQKPLAPLDTGETYTKPLTPKDFITTHNNYAQ